MANIKPKYNFSIPESISRVTAGLKNGGFSAYLVGGCVRDLVLGRIPKDWDVTTNAKPEQIQAIFEDSFYENDFGTVGVKTESTNSAEAIVEVTPYRIEGKYSDKRHPDEVRFSDRLEDDLKRRDFTMNALAYDEAVKDIIDPFGGIKDIGAKLVRAVGEAESRFNEDALRMLRAVRFSAELGFSIEESTSTAIFLHSNLIKEISGERIRDEFIKLVMSPNPLSGLVLSHKLGILKHFLPELEEGIGSTQNHAHKYDVFEHIVRSVQHSADKNFPLETRLATLLHDIGKPRTRRVSRESGTTFYGHEVVGAKMAVKIMERLKFSRETTDKVVKMVRWHMFFSDTEKITLSAVRRMIVNVGQENIWPLMDLRTCDRVGTGRPKENPYRLRKYRAMIDEAMHDPLSVGMLKIDGNDLKTEVKIEPGPKYGLILHALLDEVLDDPKKNDHSFLVKRAMEMAEMDIKELRKLGEQGKQKMDEVEGEKIKEIRGKHGVK